MAEQAWAAEKADSLASLRGHEGQAASVYFEHFGRMLNGELRDEFDQHGRKSFFEAYGRRMNDEVTHPTFGYKLSYRRMLILHARMIAAWLNGEISTLSFLTTR